MMKTKEEMLGKVVRFHSKFEKHKVKLYLITDDEHSSFSQGRVTYEVVSEWIAGGANVEVYNSESVESNVEVTKDELYETWVKELGRNKAVLLSCCYPVKMVMEMTEEDAEAEIDAIELQ